MTVLGLTQTRLSIVCPRATLILMDYICIFDYKPYFRNSKTSCKNNILYYYMPMVSKRWAESPMAVSKGGIHNVSKDGKPTTLQRRAESPMVSTAQGNALGKRYISGYALQGQL